jgi:hypothetical protein
MIYNYKCANCGQEWTQYTLPNRNKVKKCIQCIFTELEKEIKV